MRFGCGRPDHAGTGGLGRPDDRSDSGSHPGRDRFSCTDPGHDRS